MAHSNVFFDIEIGGQPGHFVGCDRQDNDWHLYDPDLKAVTVLTDLAIAVVVGVVGYVVVALWGVVGLVRGAWLSLEGRKPCFADFTRWDRPASARLLGSGILLAIVIAVAGAIATLIGAGLGKLNEALSVIPMIVVAINSPDPTIDADKINPGPRYFRLALNPTGGSRILDESSE